MANLPFSIGQDLGVLFFGYTKTFCSTPRFDMLDDYHIEELLKLS